MKLLIVSDIHVDSGQQLGVGDSRLRDAERILDEICDGPEARSCHALVFLGDLARTAAPQPAAYRIAQNAFAKFNGPVFLLQGNHDYLPGRERNLDVVAAGLEIAEVIDRPLAVTRHLGSRVTTLQQVGLAFLPWTPPMRLFDQAPHSPRSLNALVTERLHEVARGLAAELPDDKPKILLAHWLVSGAKLPSGSGVIEAREPLLDADTLLAAGFDLVVCGHNHVSGEVHPGVWSCGPPMRSSFGEADITPGYMVVSVHADGTQDVTARHVPVEDRRLITLDLDPETFLSTPVKLGDLDGAVVRVRYECREDQAVAMAEGFKNIATQLRQAGVSKIVGPQVKVIRQRRERERIDVDIDPHAALARYLDAQGVEPELRTLILTEAADIMGERPPAPDELELLELILE